MRIAAFIIYILAIFSGFWLSKLGRPLNTPIFTIHKLAGLVVFILMILILKNNISSIMLNSLTVFIIALTFILFAGIIATGGIMSFEKSYPRVVFIVHTSLPFLTAISVGIAYYLIKS